MQHRLDPTHKKILRICESTPNAINDRPLLLAKFYENDWNFEQTLYYNFTRLTRVETILRRFRDLREWGYITESEVVEDKNLEAMRSERERHSSTSPQIFITKDLPSLIKHVGTNNSTYICDRKPPEQTRLV